MRFDKSEKSLIIKNRKEYPNLYALLERQNAWDFGGQNVKF